MAVAPPSLVWPSKSKKPDPPWLLQSYAHRTLQFDGVAKVGVVPIPDPLVTARTVLDGGAWGDIVVVVVVGEAAKVGGADVSARDAAAEDGTIGAVVGGTPVAGVGAGSDVVGTGFFDGIGPVTEAAVG
jgi:hypothetical protein